VSFLVHGHGKYVSSQTQGHTFLEKYPSIVWENTKLKNRTSKATPSYSARTHSSGPNYRRADRRKMWTAVSNYHIKKEVISIENLL
jgi:hypothetical protein